MSRDENCTRCKLSTTCNTICLWGTGPKKTDIMIVGEAPGDTEDREGEPFVGSSGKLLRSILDQYHLDPKDCYITNSVKCRPPGNKTPGKRELTACSGFLADEFLKVKPKFVLLLGNIATQAVLGLKGIKKLRGKPIKKEGVIYLPTYHPSLVLRDPRQKEILQADISLFSMIVESGDIPREEDLDMVIVKNDRDIRDMFDDLAGAVSFDIETTCLYPWADIARVNAIGFGTRSTQWIVPMEHEECELTEDQKDDILSRITQLIKKKKIKLIAQNGKFDSLWMKVKYGVTWPIWFDTMIAHFLLNENAPHGLKYLSKVFLGALDYDVDTDTKVGKKGFEPMAFYQAHDLLYTRKLWKIFAAKLEKEPSVKQVFDHILMPCVNIFTNIEYRGVYLNLDRMNEVERYLRKKKAEAEKKLNSHLPKNYGEMNWGSTQQLGKLLFEDLKLPIIEKTKKGAPSVNESVVKRIEHPLVEALLEFRGAKQQLSFFIDGWKPYIHKGRLHPSFKLHGTVTGRLSCENPNLQQVPRDPAIRSLIGAPPGWVLIEADLSQIELRIAAELSGDKSLTYAYSNGIDVHWLTAIREIERGGGLSDLVFKTARGLGLNTNDYAKAIKVILEAGNEKAEAVDVAWKELRKKAKAVNFGYLYGMWWKKFKIYARDNYGVTVTDEQAQASREYYFQTYDGLPDWHKRQKQFVRRHGYVPTLSGRKRRLPDAMSPHDSPERGAAERQAINSPVQSFANELNLMALIQLTKEFSPKVFQPVGTVHDAILMEAREGYVEEVHNRCLEIMSQPDLLNELSIRLRIPVEAEAKVGDWGNGVKLSKWLKERKNDKG